MDCFYQVRPPEEGVGVPRALAWNLGSPVTPVWHLLSSARLDPGGRWDKEARRLCQGWEGGWAEISSIRKCGRDKRCVCAVFVGRSSNWGLAFHKQPLGKDLVIICSDGPSLGGSEDLPLAKFTGSVAGSALNSTSRYLCRLQFLLSKLLPRPTAETQKRQ